MINELEELFYDAFDGVFFLDNPYYGSVALTLHQGDISFVGYNSFNNEYTTAEK